MSSEIFEWQPKKLSLERSSMESTILEENHERKDVKPSVTISENTLEESKQGDGEVQSPPNSTVPSLPFLDHSPGEVYTIPEEEEEAASPTGGDGVTSLRHRGGQCPSSRVMSPCPARSLAHPSQRYLRFEKG